MADCEYPEGECEFYQESVEFVAMKAENDRLRNTLESAAAMIEKLRDDGKFAPESPGLLTDLASRVRAMAGE